MLWKRASAVLFAALAWPMAALAQLPPASGIVINQTPVQNGTANLCLYVTSTGKVGQQACGSGTAANVTVGTTTITSGTTGRLLYDNAGTIGEALIRYSAANLSLGDVDAAAPVAQALNVQNVVAGTTDIAGAALTLNLSQGTGTGTGGGLTVRYAAASTTGNTQNALANTFGIAGATGNVFIGTSSASNAQLRVGRAITGTTSSYGITVDGTVQSATTNTAASVRAIVNTVAAAFTLTNYNTISAELGTIGAASAITNLRGFNCDSSMVGGTNTYCFYSAIASGSGRFGYYAAGTAANAFVSDLTIYNGTAIPAGGTAGSGFKFSSTSNFGIFFGSGAPSLSAAKGSLYLRSDGSTVNDRAYINSTGSTTWVSLTTGG